jgi:hypothetical protein
MRLSPALFFWCVAWWLSCSGPSMTEAEGAERLSRGSRDKQSVTQHNSAAAHKKALAPPFRQCPNGRAAFALLFGLTSLNFGGA